MLVILLKTKRSAPRKSIWIQRVTTGLRSAPVQAADKWQSFEAARQAMIPNLTRSEPAARYGVIRAAA
ncbi:MAG: hypothetical protein C5B51_29710 [Terriglobia bacterium]|nr:MAG: hypothetical protein C5B51_29710 [Terriglobia bacterium]